MRTRPAPSGEGGEILSDAEWDKALIAALRGTDSWSRENVEKLRADRADRAFALARAEQRNALNEQHANALRDLIGLEHDQSVLIAVGDLVREVAALRALAERPRAEVLRECADWFASIGQDGMARQVRLLAGAADALEAAEGETTDAQ